VRSLRQYRLFLTLLVVPVLVIVLVVAVVVAISGSGEDEGSVASVIGTDRLPITATSTITGSSAPAVKPAAVTIAVPPTQTPVPHPSPAAASSATPTAPPIPTPTPKPEGPVEYEVKQTDTLSTIAVQFGVSVADLVEFNELPDENFVFVGQVLEIPTDAAQIIERRESKPKRTTGVVIPAEGLNVRDQPSTETGVVQYVAGGGTELALTGASKELDGVKWWEIEDGNWTQGQYLELGVNAALTPAVTETATPTEMPTTADGEATPTTTATVTTTPSAGSANPILATIIPPAGLNVRKSASQAGEVAYIAATNTAIELSGETTNVDGVVWWQVVDGNWVQGRFLKFG
jgi:LysM repeat protein